jgi:hypothetical protein
MAQTKRITVVVGLTFLFFAAVAILFWRTLQDRVVSFRVALPDGTQLSLASVHIGEQTEFKHGTVLERMLGNVIPAKGFQISKWAFSRPMVLKEGAFGVPSLCLEFRLDGPANVVNQSRLVTAPMFREFRVLLSGSDGFAYVEELWPFKRYADGVFGYLNSSTYPRISPFILVQIQQRGDQNTPWKQIAEFSCPNPSIKKEEQWQPESYPIRKSKGIFGIKLEEIQIQATNGYWHDSDIWEHSVQIPLKFYLNGISVTNWAAHDVWVSDSIGNLNPIPSISSVTNGWIVYRSGRSVHPHGIWKIRADFTPESDLKPTNIFTVKINLPLTKAFETNLAGFPLKIDFVNESMLAMSIPTNYTNSRLIFLHANGKNGNPIGEVSGSWGQHSFWRSMNLNAAGSEMTVTVGIVPNVHFDFTVKPRLVDHVRVPQRE